MMQFKTLLILFLLFAARVNSQSSCPNSDFESGTLDGWSGRIGVCCPINTYTSGPLPTGIIEGRHTLMTGTGTDPNTCNNVTVVAPGGLYSARVGNERTNSEAETLAYTITVSPSSLLFIYKYAVVLQDPGHDPDEQPRFQVRVLDENGELIDPACGEYTVVAGAGLAGFQTCDVPGKGVIRYRDWTTVGLNLSAYMGRTLSIEFETGDCSPGAHFGYAYVDAYCSPLAIDASFCTSSNAAELTAPIGFSYLWSTGATTQTIVVNNPIPNSIYSCTLTSVTGCSVTISTTLQMENPIADFALTNSCFDNAVFDDTTILINPSLLDGYLWDFGDGYTSDVQNPVHSFPAPGTYTVQFTAFNSLGCSTSVTKTITVYQEPSADIYYDADSFCTSETVLKTPHLTGTGNYSGGVYTSDLPGLSLNPTTGAFNPSTSAPGNYVINYTIPPQSGCAAQPASTNVAIYLMPQAFINYTASVYCKSISSPQIPNLTGTGTITRGNYTAMPSGLSINSVSGQVNPSQSQEGTYTIKYTVPSSGNVCASVNAFAILTILPLPEPILSNFAICKDPAGNIFRPALLDTGLSDLLYSCQWFFNGNLIPGVTVNRYTASAEGNYSVLVTNLATGCISPAVVSTVSNAQVVEDFQTYISNTFSDNNTLTVIVSGGTGPYLFRVDNQPFQASNVFTQLSPGIHTVSITDVNNCTDVTKRITVLGFPNFFTPNGDGKNDLWNIYYFDAQPNAKIYIYDRFGKLITGLTPQSPGWDGTYNGKLLPSDDYWFMVEFKDYDQNGELVWQTFKSHFSMLR